MVSQHRQDMLAQTVNLLTKRGITAEKLDALAGVVSAAANLPIRVAKPYAINFVYWRMPSYPQDACRAHEYTAKEQEIPDLCADARAKIDAAYALLFT